MTDKTDTSTDLDEMQTFDIFAATHRGGAFAVEAGEQLRDLIAAVVEHERAGTMTIKVSVAHDGQNLGAPVLKITDDVTVKAPRAAREQVMYFVSDDLELSRHSPNQIQMFATETSDIERQK